MIRIRYYLLSYLTLLILAAPVPAQYYNDEPTILVRSWYQRYLNREADSPGLILWTDSLRRGQSPEMVLASILSSPEYFTKGGGTPDGFLLTLFQDVASRPPTSAEMTRWLGRMFLAEQRVNVAYALLLRHPEAWR